MPSVTCDTVVVCVMVESVCPFMLCHFFREEGDLKRHTHNRKTGRKLRERELKAFSVSDCFANIQESVQRVARARATGFYLPRRIIFIALCICQHFNFQPVMPTLFA